MEADLLDALRLGADARIGSQNAADVGPDLDALRRERRADDGGGVVRAATAQGRNLARLTRRDKAAKHRNKVLLHQRWDCFQKFGAGRSRQRRCGGMTGIGDDQLSGVGVGGRNSERGEGRSHQNA